MIKPFPKIFAIGHREIINIFDDEVEITEKIDGNQFDFGKIDGELFICSKNVRIMPECPPKMFKIGVEYVLSIQDKLTDNFNCYCKYLNKPKHNALKYNRIPKNNLILFGVSTSEDMFLPEYNMLEGIADYLCIEVVPLLFKGKINNEEDLFRFMKEESVLGGCLIEGIVVKNYNKTFLLSGRGQYFPLMAGKLYQNNPKNIIVRNGKRITVKKK